MSGGASLAPHSEDAFLGGRVLLLQPKKGHRAGLDAALLQAVVPGDAAGLLVDFGAGVGTVAFAAAARATALRAVALEREPDLVALAQAALRHRENAGFAERVRAAMADVTSLSDVRRALGEADHTADWVLMNPPYDTSDRGRPSPDAGRRSAHVGDAALLGAWIATAATLLKPGGRLGVIHRAETLPALLAAIAGAFGGIALLPVHPSAEAPASRIVVRAEKGSHAPLRVSSGLVLHQPDGGWTREADAILRGHAVLPL